MLNYKKVHAPAPDKAFLKHADFHNLSPAYWHVPSAGTVHYYHHPPPPSFFIIPSLPFLLQVNLPHSLFAITLSSSRRSPDICMRWQSPAVVQDLVMLIYQSCASENFFTVYTYRKKKEEKMGVDWNKVPPVTPRWIRKIRGGVCNLEIGYSFWVY